MVFSYTVFLNNMFLRYKGVFLVSRFHAKIVFFLFVGWLNGSKYPNRYMDYYSQAGVWGICPPTNRKNTIFA
jgi:hypothetical protein